MAEQQQAPQRRGREGGRWINERPSSAEFAEWFTTSMKIDPELRVEDYVGGVVLIPAVDTKAKYVTGFTNTGVPIIEEREELSFIPYAKVEARIDYFWDLMEVHQDDRVGIVERVTPPRLPIDFVHTEEREVTGVTEGGAERERTINRKIRTPSAMTALAHTLPDGFSIASIPVGAGYSHFLLCTTRVSIYRREDYDAKGDQAVPLRRGQGTKQVPLLLGRNQPYADSSSVMKAETGSLGRALGFAGIFVIPGSGVATAEDMLEAMTQGQAPSEAATPANQGPAAPAAPPAKTGAEQQVDEETALRQRATVVFKKLQADHPAKAEEFAAWAHKRRLSSLGEAKGAMLRGVVRKLETLADEGEQSAQQAPDLAQGAAAQVGGQPDAGESGASDPPQTTQEAVNVPGPSTEKLGNGEEN